MTPPTPDASKCEKLSDDGCSIVSTCTSGQVCVDGSCRSSGCGSGVHCIGEQVCCDGTCITPPKPDTSKCETLSIDRCSIVPLCRSGEICVIGTCYSSEKKCGSGDSATYCTDSQECCGGTCIEKCTGCEKCDAISRSCVTSCTGSQICCGGTCTPLPIPDTSKCEKLSDDGCSIVSSCTSGQECCNGSCVDSCPQCVISDTCECGCIRKVPICCPIIDESECDNGVAYDDDGCPYCDDETTETCTGTGCGGEPDPLDPCNCTMTYGLKCMDVNREVNLEFCCNPNLHENGCSWDGCLETDEILATYRDCDENGNPVERNNVLQKGLKVATTKSFDADTCYIPCPTCAVPRIVTNSETGQAIIYCDMKCPIGYSCCGGIENCYNPKTESCCGGTIYTKSDTTDCCKGTIYNPQTHACCGLGFSQTIVDKCPEGKELDDFTCACRCPEGQVECNGVCITPPECDKDECEELSEDKCSCIAKCEGEEVCCDGTCKTSPTCDPAECKGLSEDGCSCESSCSSSQECCWGECYEKNSCGEMGRNEEFCHCNECTKDSHCEGELVCCKVYGGCMEKEECDTSKCQVWSSETCGCVSSCAEGERCDLHAGGICRAAPDCEAIVSADSYVQGLLEACNEANKTNTIATGCWLNTSVGFDDWLSDGSPCAGTGYYCRASIEYKCYYGHVRDCNYSGDLVNTFFCPTFE